MTRNRTCLVLFSMIILLVFSVAELYATSATLYVKATILPFVRMDIQQHKTDFVLSLNDLDRNHLDIPFSATVNIDTNVPVLILTLLPSGNEQILASVSGRNNFDNTLEIILSESERFARHVTRDLDFRVLLDKKSQPGPLFLAPGISVQGY